ncbi:MAG: bifunctional nuclease family protein [Phycisphaerales bacterium]
MSVRMELSRILIREMTDQQIIELSEVGGSRRIPIVIGTPEAFAIERRLKGIEIPRPQTHDLLDTVIRELGGTLRMIEIHDLNDSTFFARLLIDRNGETFEVDSRPSDAIALGIAGNVDIYVAESVLDQLQSDESVDEEGDLADDDDLEFDPDDDENEPF